MAFGLDYFEDRDHEKNISAKCFKTQASPRIPCKNENPQWSCNYQCTASQRTGFSKRLIQDAFVSEAFKKSNRLLNSVDFGHVFSNGTRKHGKYFLVVCCVNKLGFARLGIAVSRKVSKKAVVRNLIKRQIRESFRSNKELLGGMDCVVVAKYSAANTNQPSLRSSIDAHWQKISENA